MKKQQYILFALLFLILVLSRLLPHPANFSAITGVALFSGSFWSKSISRFLLPLGVIFLTDAYFGFYPGALFTYLGVLLIVLQSPALKSSFFKLLGHSFVAACIFFVVSNFGVWLQSGLYPMTWSGFVDCYAMAIPFFRNTFLSTAFYAFVFYSFYRVAFSKSGMKGFFVTSHGR